MMIRIDCELAWNNPWSVIPLVYTIGLNCVSRTPYMQKPAVNLVHQQPYNLGPQPILQVSFTVMARSKAVILGRQTFCTVLTLSTAQVLPICTTNWKTCDD